mmetsp:Transcript_23027/g.62780  ORF Transcript_23027/g.62780 Transcript_23027/m.62780 type:complete len:711 (-) Transcript_23027:47-2179(-)
MGARLVVLPALLAALLAGQARAGQDAADPLQKVLQLLTDLHGKVVKEGEGAHKTYVEFSEWCEDRSKNLKYEVATAKSEIAELKAAIDQASATSNALETQIEETTGSIATAEADLKAATKIRKAEEADFATEEKELVEVVSVLERAIAVLEREAHKGGAAMVQVKNAGTLLQAVRAMLDASMVGSQDASALTALVQNAQRDKDESDSLQAPEAAAYQGQSGSIIETLEDLLDKAKDQLDAARTKETSARHNFEMLAQSLNDEMKFGNEDFAKAKKNLALQKEAKASAQGDLGMTSSSLAEDEKTMGTLKQDCLMKAQDYEAETKSRDEELKALVEAKKVLSEMSGNAADVTYSFGQTSLVQLRSSARSTAWTSADLANFEAVRLVRNLAKKEHSEALALLARRMASAMRYSTASGDDPFAKVKGLIRDMIETLAKDANADATHKAYCDKEMGDTAQKTEDLTGSLDRLSAKIDQKKAASVTLKSDVQLLQSELAELARSQVELDKVRSEEHKVYVQLKADLEQGLSGIRMALKILREYYAAGEAAAGASFVQRQPEVPVYHSKAAGSSTGIIGMLEVVESDFGKGLAQAEMDEDSAATEYEKVTRQSEISRTVKDQDVKYKGKEAVSLDKAVADLVSDRDSAQAELDAVLQYSKGIRAACVHTPMSYEERRGRREAEVAGLREALQILEGNAVLMQRHQFGLRGASAKLA